MRVCEVRAVIEKCYYNIKYCGRQNQFFSSSFLFRSFSLDARNKELDIFMGSNAVLLLVFIIIKYAQCTASSSSSSHTCVLYNLDRVRARLDIILCELAGRRRRKH